MTALELPPPHIAPRRWRVYMVAKHGRFLGVHAYKIKKNNHSLIIRRLSYQYRTYNIKFLDMSDAQLFRFACDNNISL